KEFGRFHSEKQGLWEAFSSKLNYVSVDLQNAESYIKLKETLTETERQYQLPGNRVFYLAISPELFGDVSNNLKASELLETSGWKRL
ncbi:hypothetical protein ABTG83_20075, partial [Acinetobacter baumannii]